MARVTDAPAEQLFRQAVELGITFWDTANIYGNGSSEEIVGRAIKAYTRRENVVLAMFRPMGQGPGGARPVPTSRPQGRATRPPATSQRSTGHEAQAVAQGCHWLMSHAARPTQTTDGPADERERDL
jgi:aryl-alcohol dehydrogenase-like predicted oxidoreductase